MMMTLPAHDSDSLDDHIHVEQGQLGKLVMARLKPNQDLTESVEALCRQHGMDKAIVRGAIGSLIDAHLQYATRPGACDGDQRARCGNPQRLRRNRF
jgi:Predicted DNA-binding protein with PD1-like DNA-binding motif